jgi:hypothetical protein
MQVQLTVSNHLTPWILQGTDDPASPGPLVEGKMQKEKSLTDPLKGLDG